MCLMLLLIVTFSVLWLNKPDQKNLPHVPPEQIFPSVDLWRGSVLKTNDITIRRFGTIIVDKGLTFSLPSGKLI